MKKTEHTITVEVSGTLSQNIKLKDEFAMTEEELNENIRAGNLFTSIGHSANNGFVYLWDTGNDMVECGKIVSQEANDDVELEVFIPKEEY
jgi:low affinity Fe/Cu permease